MNNVASGIILTVNARINYSPLELLFDTWDKHH